MSTLIACLIAHAEGTCGMARQRMAGISRQQSVHADNAAEAPAQPTLGADYELALDHALSLSMLLTPVFVVRLVRPTEVHILTRTQ